MSVIVVFKDNNRVLAGCDTRSSDNYSFMDGYVSSKKARHVDINRKEYIEKYSYLLNNGESGILVYVHKKFKYTRRTLDQELMNIYMIWTVSMKL